MVSLKRSCTSQMNRAVPGPSSVEPTSLPRLLLAIADVEMACDDLLPHPQRGMSHAAAGAAVEIQGSSAGRGDRVARLQALGGHWL